MKLAVLTPLPPVKSGIAHYSAMILGELARRHEVTAVVDQEQVDFDACPWVGFDSFANDTAAFDAVVCQLGNNLHHEFVWNWAKEHPALVVLHEIVMHHLLVETTLARGNADELTAALREEYGEAGVRVAEARAAGIHGELANFLFPASRRIAESATHVIVHNQWAADRLRAEGVSTPITIVTHPFESPPTFDADEARRRRQASGWGENDRVVGAFGFVTSAKRPEVVMEAFASAVRRDPGLRLVFVGEAAPNVDLQSMAERWSIPAGTWMATGYVTNREFDLWLNTVDRVVSLRYPTAGESSGPIVRAFAVGRPVAVSDYAQFAEFPDSLVVRIPFDDERGALERFMTDETLDNRGIGAAQREWLERTSTVVKTVDGYERALLSGNERSVVSAVRERLALFPVLHASLERDGEAVVVRLTNQGATTLQCARWGEPEYRLRVRFVRPDGTSVQTVRRLGCDLRPGETISVVVADAPSGADRIELHHGLSGIPDADTEPFATLELAS